MSALLTNTGAIAESISRLRRSARPGWRQRIAEAVANRIEYLIPAVSVAGIAQTWFRPGQHIAGGDVAPFVRDSLIASLPDLWGYQLTAAGSPSYEIARIFDVVVIQTAEMMGLGAPTTQRIFYTLLAILAAVAGTYLAAAFTKRLSLQVAAGVWAVANPYWLVLIPNPIFLLAIALGSLLAGFMVRAARAQPPPIWKVAAASMLLAPLSVNPPLLAVMTCWIVLLVAAGRLVGGPGGCKRALLFSSRALPWVMAINLFWLVPAALTFSAISTSVAAEVSAEAWSWSHAQNTVPNLVSLTAHWGWAFPDTYYPYAPRLDRGWFTWMRFTVPALAGAAPFLASGTRRKITIAVLSVVATAGFVGKGLHPPLASVNMWLYDQVPGMWLLREPMSKVGWVMVIAYLVGAVIAADRLLDLASRARRWRIPLISIPVLAAAAGLVFVHPLWSGEAVPEDRGQLPGSHVEIPQAWEQVAGVVNQLDDGGTVLLLPIPGFYQMGHAWGYHGVDQVPTQLITRRTLQVSDGGYYRGAPAYQAAARLLQSALLASDTTQAGRLLEALGISTVVVRHDYDSDTSLGDLADPGLLVSALGLLEGTRPVLNTPVADVWQVAPTRPRISVTTDLVISPPLASPEVTARALAATRPGSTLLPSGSLTPTEEEAHAWVIDQAAAEIDLDQAADLVVSINPITSPTWRFNPSAKGLEATALHQLIVDGESALWSEPINYPTSSAPVAMSIDGRIVSLDEPLVMPTAPGTTFNVYTTVDALQPTAPLDPVVGDCNAYDARSPEEAGLAMEKIPDGLRLSAVAHSACVRYLLPSGSGQLVAVNVDAAGVTGSPPRICVFSPATSTCVASATLDAPSGTLSAMAPADPGLELYLYADEPAPESTDLVTVADYYRPTIELLQASATLRLPELPTTVTLDGLSPGIHTIGTTTVARSAVPPLSLLSSLEDCHRYDQRTPEQAGLLLTRPTAQSLRLHSKAHTACVWIPLGPPQFGALDVSLEYRVLSGAPARICLWQVGPERCAELPALPRGSGWQQFTATAHPDLTADGLRLYFYADAPPQQVDVTTVVEYRNLEWSPGVPWTLVATSQPRPPRAISPTRVTSSPAKATIELPADLPAGPVLVVLNDTFDPRWTLTGATDAQHLLVDGWANGWLFDDGTRLSQAEIVVSYPPDGWARLAGLVSITALTAAFLIPVVARFRSHRRKPNRPTTGTSGA